MPSISLIIPTLNRRQLLRDTVGYYLDGQTFSDFELIIVDQGAARDAELESQFGHDERLRYYHVEFQSLTRARNFGVANARAELIVFSDDDVIPSSNQLATYFEYFSNSTGSGAAGPVVALGKRLRCIDELTDLERSRLVPGRYLACFDADFRHSVVFACGANCAFRRSAIVQLGGFDEEFTGSAWGEDYEFCYRLRKRFGTIEYLPEASVIHLTTPTGGCRDLKNGKYVRDLCRNSIYTHFRTNAGFLNTSHECWGLMRRFVFNRTALRRPRPHWIGAVALGCYDGFRASRLPRKLPLSPPVTNTVSNDCAEVGAGAEK